jgi:hypothetical protein
MISFKHYFVEKLILGLEEDIFLDGLGRITAKLDTGNGAFNVLHGENIETDGKLIRFTTMNNISLQKEVTDTITINVGAGHKEDRPVVLFDVKMGNNKFKDVAFSIGNRADNIHKVLIGKDFIQNQLDALIDVGLTNVANKQLEVEV